MLALLFAARTAMGFQFQAVGSVGSYIASDLHVTYAAVGTLIGLYLLPGVVVSLPGGMLAGRFADKTVCATGLLMMVAGGAWLGAAHGVGEAMAARTLSGAGAVVFNLVLTKMAADWFAGREIVLAMAAVLASWPFGIGLGSMVQPALAAAHGWRWLMHLTAAASGLALLLMLILYRSPPGAVRAAEGTLLPPRRALPAMLAAGAMWGCFNTPFVLFVSFAPFVLLQRGLSLVAATIVTGAGMWIVMVSVPLAGAVVQRLGRPDAAIVLFGLIAGLILLCIPLGIFPLIACLLYGAAMGPPAGAIMALPARVLAPGDRAAGYGVFFTVFYAMMAAAPAVAGALRDLTGTPAAALVLAAGLMASVAPLLGVFRLLARPLRAAVQPQGAQP